MMSAILNSTILDSAMLNKKTSLIHSDSNWWWQPSLICHVRYRNCHLGFIHLVIFSEIHSKILSLHSDSESNKFNLTQTNSFSPNLMMAAILNSAIMNLGVLDSAILVFPLKLTHTCQDWFLVFAQKKLHSFILTQLDHDSHLEFYHFGFSQFAWKNFTNSFLLNLMMAAILNSSMLDSDTAILDLDTLLSSLRFTQKHSHSTLTLTQTNSIWFKLIHSHLT